LLGQDGNDFLIGDASNDSLDGGSGRDTLEGRNGQDTLTGGSGNDLLAGDRGDDLLIGNTGKDRMQGGGDRDRFALQSGKGFALIIDFQQGQDQLGLSGTLTFSRLSFSQRRTAAVIRFQDDKLAELEGVTASALTPNDFTFI
jgi:Ca2+-binding RTX toxin-like protein